MLEKYETIKTIKYKGHTIRVAKSEFGIERVFIDNFEEYIETAPFNLFDADFDYASIADAKRMINGEMPKYIPAYLDYPELRKLNLRERFFNRFKKK